jgi:Glycosyl hydrolases family 31
MQLTDAIRKPSLPPYWALGFHLCRTDTDMDAVKENVTSLRKRDIPFDTDCGSAGLSTELFDKNSNRELLKYFNDLAHLIPLIKPLIIQAPQRDQTNPGDPKWEQIALRRPGGDIYHGRFYNWKEMDSGKFSSFVLAQFQYQFSTHLSFSVDINRNKSVIYPSFWDGIIGTDELLSYSIINITVQLHMLDLV